MKAHRLPTKPGRQDWLASWKCRPKRRVWVKGQFTVWRFLDALSMQAELFFRWRLTHLAKDQGASLKHFGEKGYDPKGAIDT